MRPRRPAALALVALSSCAVCWLGAALLLALLLVLPLVLPLVLVLVALLPCAVPVLVALALPFAACLRTFARRRQSAR